MASYLGKNVNLALLVIIIGVIVALVGTTVFFQRSLQTRTGAYESTTGELQQCQTALENFQAETTAAQAQVNQTLADIDIYDNLYEQKSAELQEMRVLLEKTQAQLSFEQVQKERFQQFYEGAIAQAVQLNKTIEDLRDEIDDLEDELDAC